MSPTIRPGIPSRWIRSTVLVVAALVAVLVVVAEPATPATPASPAKISISPNDVDPGTSVVVTGRAFPNRVRGSVNFGGRTVARFDTSSRGTFSARWTVPAGATSGPVLAETASRRASVRLRVVPTSPQPPNATCPTPSPAPPNVGPAQPSAPVQGQRWSDPATWESGQVPQDGAAATVPAGETVVLDRNVRLASLDVRGTLVFDNADLELQSDWIMVHGKLQIGTAAAPFRNEATITLTDDNPGENVMNMGDKVLGVMGGTLELHGERRAGWTRLAATAGKGSRSLTLQGNPGWRVGDRIAIASTDYAYSQSEEREVTAVSGNTLTLDRPLTRQHWGTVQTIDGCRVDERAEVALLSRNITVRGEETSSANGVGGQIMVMNMEMGGTTHQSTARLEGVELDRMGQNNVLRRYPIHFHMLGDAGAQSYLKNSSAHHTFNRCVVVHGTNGLDVQNNVCFDHLGHGYFLEDGAEHDNLITGNLGFGTRKPEQGQGLLPSDGSPATFWITNPDNVVRNNVAAGSDGSGFWLAFPEHPTGLSATDDVWPRRTPLGEFSGKVAHSNGGDGLHVDNGPRPDGETETTYYHPRQDPSDTGSAEVVANFETFVGYKNRNRAVWLRGENHRLAGATLADNAIGATFASSESFLDRSLVVGESANKGSPESWETVGRDGRSLPRFWEPDFPIRGFEFYDGRVGARDSAFVNFTPDSQRKASGLGVLLADAFSLHPRNFASSLRFVDANRFYMRGPEPGKDGDNSAVFVDQTGSVTGRAGSVVTARNAFLTVPEGCPVNAGWNANVCPPDTRHVGLIAYALEGDPGRQLRSYVKPLTITRESDGKPQTLMGCCEDSTDAFTNLLPDRGYRVAFNGGSPLKMRFVLRYGNARWLRLSMPYPVTPKVTKYGCDVSSTEWCGGGKASSLQDLGSKTVSGYYYDGANDRLYVKLYAVNRYDPTAVIDYEALEVGPAP